MSAQMAGQAAQATVRSRRLGRSAAAIAGGFLAVAVLSLGTDQLLHVLGIYPPWGQPMHDAGLNLLALSYRILYTIAGGYITARLAPHAPMRHAVILGVVGLALASAGAIATTNMQLGPNWYPIALVVTSLPCVWAGARIHLRTTTDLRGEESWPR